MVNLLVSIILFAGLVLTLSPRYPGTVIIFAGTVIYGAYTGFVTFTPWVWILLIALMIIAEVGGRLLRIWLTQEYSLSRYFSVNSVVGNFGGILAVNALLGPVLGIIVWELIAGKTLLPRGKTVARIIYRLAAAAVLRLVCGLAMVALTLIYIFV